MTESYDRILIQTKSLKIKELNKLERLLDKWKAEYKYLRIKNAN